MDKANEKLVLGGHSHWTSLSYLFTARPVAVR